MGRRRSDEDWALERERQEALTLRDRRYRRNALAIAAVVAVLLDPFGGAGDLLDGVLDHVRSGSVPGQQAPDLRRQTPETPSPTPQNARKERAPPAAKDAVTRTVERDS